MSYSIEELGTFFKVGRNSWKNYPCPMCKDGKKDHFWVAPDQQVGYCRKCGKTVRFHIKVCPVITPRHLYLQGLLSLQKLTEQTMLNPRTVNPCGNLSPASTPYNLQDNGWSLITPEHYKAIPEAAKIVLANYFQDHHLSITKIGLGLHIYIRMQQQTVGIFFGTSNLGIVGPGALRVLTWGDNKYAGPKWINVGKAQPVEPPGILANETQWFVVESLGDRLRLRCHKPPLFASALMGTHLSSILPVGLSNSIVVMLDSDATDKAVKVQQQLQTTYPLAKVFIWHIPHDPITGKTRDPSDLSDEELDEITIHINGLATRANL